MIYKPKKNLKNIFEGIAFLKIVRYNIRNACNGATYKRRKVIGILMLKGVNYHVNCNSKVCK